MKGSERPRIGERVFAHRQQQPLEEAEQPRLAAGAAQVTS